MLEAGERRGTDLTAGGQSVAQTCRKARQSVAQLPGRFFFGVEFFAVGKYRLPRCVARETDVYSGAGRKEKKRRQPRSAEGDEDRRRRVG